MSTEPEPKTPQPDPKRLVVRQLIPILVVVCLLSGSVMLLRAYFLQHPLTPSASILGNSAFPTNDLLTIAGAVTELSAASKLWGDGVKNLPGVAELEEEGIWLQVSSPEEIRIGVLTAEGFTTIYEFPSRAKAIQIFEGGEHLFILPATTLENSRLLGVENGVITQIYQAGRVTTEILSAYFDYETKQFFLVEADSGRTFFKQIRPTGTVLPVYELMDMYNPEILGVEAGRLYFKVFTGVDEFGECRQLDLVTKELRETDCNKVKRGRADVSYTAGRPGIFEADSQGSILKTDLKSGKEDFLLFAREGEWIDRLVLTKDKLTFVLSDILAGSSLASVIAKELQVFDLKAERVVRKVSELPFDPILEAGLLGEKLVTIVRSTKGIERIVIESAVEVSGEEDEQSTESKEAMIWQEIPISGCGFNCQFKFFQ